MHHEEELKQLKTEYRSISVPCDGADQLSYVMEHAKADRVKAMRKRRGYMRTFGVLAAAAVVVVLLLPATKGMFLMGGSAPKADSNMAYDATAESMLNAGMTDGYVKVEMDISDKYTAAKPEESKAEEAAPETGEVITPSSAQNYSVKLEFSDNVLSGTKGKSLMPRVFLLHYRKKNFH